MYWEQVEEYHASRKTGYTYYGNYDTIFKGLGIEEEFDCEELESRAEFREAVAEILFNHRWKDHYFVEKDRSLSNGMEFITQPHTIEAMREFLSVAMSDIMNKVSNVGVQNCSPKAATHIHISKTVFGDTYEEQKESISKLWYMVSRNEWSFFKLGNRRHTYKCLFPAPRLTIKKAKAKVNYEYNLENKMSNRFYKYQAINLRQKNTIEIRVMQSTTDINTLTAWVELWWHLANKSTTIAWEDAKSLDKWLEDAPYIIKAYVAEKLAQ